MEVNKMLDIRLLKQDLERMREKRNNICIELGYGYDWMLVDSLIAIDSKIKQLETKLESIEEC
jgi:hypothetical protein